MRVISLGIDEGTERLDPLLMRIEMRIVRCAAEIDAPDAPASAYECRLLFLGEHSSVCVDHEGGQLDALPLAPARLPDRLDRRLHDVRVETWDQTVDCLLQILDPGTFERPVTELRRRFRSICERDVPRPEEVADGSVFLHRAAPLVPFEHDQRANEVWPVGSQEHRGVRAHRLPDDDHRF